MHGFNSSAVIVMIYPPPPPQPICNFPVPPEYAECCDGGGENVPHQDEEGDQPPCPPTREGMQAPEAAPGQATVRRNHTTNNIDRPTNHSLLLTFPLSGKWGDFEV